MQEEVKDVQQEEVSMRCDCGGLMRYTGQAYLTSPPKFKHQCTQCTNQATYSFKYPYVRVKRS